jgi:MATE family multidrug resistance protein
MARVPAPIPTLWGLIALAAPIMLANASTPLIGFVDAAVIGRLGDAALIGGVAVGAAVFNAIYWCVSFLRMSTTGFTAQAYGARDNTETAATLRRALLIAGMIGLAIVVFQAPIRRGFLWFLGGSPAVQAATSAYYDWRIWAAPAGLANFALLGWFIGLGRTMVAFWIQLLANVLNIVFALVFVPWLGWGVSGVGLAALLSEVAAVVAGLHYARRELAVHGATASRATLFDRAKLRELLATNRDIMIRSVCVLAVGQIFIRLGATQGDAVLAANALLASILMITYFLLDGYAHAVETLVGQAVGARDRPRLDLSVRLAMIAAGITGTFIGVVLWFTAGALIAFMTTNTEVRAQAAAYCAWVAWLPLIAVGCYLLDGVFIGATRTVVMRNMMLLSFVVHLVTLAIAFPWLANHGLWLAQAVFFVARAVTLAWKYPGLAATAER